MDQLIGYIATGIVSLIVGILIQRSAAKPNLLYWLPGSFIFDLETPKVQLRTDSLTIQNSGRSPATNLEIVHKKKPDHFQFSTAISYTEENNPNGEHITKIQSLGPGEHINIQFLSHTNLPVLLSIRSDYGPAKLIEVWLQQKFPTWIYVFGSIISFVGLGFSVYWIVMAIIYISSTIGVN